MNPSSHRCVRFAALLFLLGLGADSRLYAGTNALPNNSAAGNWNSTDPMEYERYWFTATTLLDGRILVTGGYSYQSYDLATCELYDGTTGHWTETGKMRFARYSHTATLLADGRVLVAAGFDGSDLSSAEIYDPARGRWSRTGSLLSAREEHAATSCPMAGSWRSAVTKNWSALWPAQRFLILLPAPGVQPEICAMLVGGPAPRHSWTGGSWWWAV